MTTINPNQPEPATDPELLRLTQRTSNAAVFVAWVAGIWLALSLVAGIWVATTVAHTASVINSPAASICQSLGGTDPSC